MALRILRQAIVLAVVTLPSIVEGTTCAVGDAVTAVWAGSVQSSVPTSLGQSYAATIASMSSDQITVNWEDGDTRHRTVAAHKVYKDGVRCQACVNTAGGATDMYGDGCAYYVSKRSMCGTMDDSDFTAREMCCGCGGGSPALNPVPTAPNPVPTPTEMATLTAWTGSNSCSGTGVDQFTVNVTQPVTNGCVNGKALTSSGKYNVGETFSIKYECAAGGFTKETYYRGAGCVGTPVSSDSMEHTGYSTFLRGSYGGQCADLQGSTGAVSARLSKPLVNLKNIPACDMAPSPPSSNSPSPSTSPGIACDTSQWSDVKLACGACKALVTNMHNDAKYGGMCSTYCAQQGLQCVAQYEEEHNNCVVASTGSCTIPGDAGRSTSDLICECTSMAPNPLPTPSEGHTAMSSDLSSAPSAPMVTIGLAAYIFVLG